MLLKDFEVRRWLESKGKETEGRLKDVSVNELPDRRVWFAPGVGVVKQFSAESLNRFVREKTLLTRDIAGFDRPEFIAGEDLGARGSLLAVALAAGEVLDAVVGDLAESEYVSLAGALGRALGRLHSATLPAEAEWPDWESPLPLARQDDLAKFPDRVSVLSESGHLSAETAEGLIEGMAATQFAKSAGNWAESTWGWIHGDVHNENVFYLSSESGSDSSPVLTFIDFEESGIAPVELDLVHPFLNILGEAFPGREFGDARGAKHPIFERFFEEYNKSAPTAQSLETVAPHAVAWYIGIARDAMEAGLEAADFYLQTGLAVAELMGWISLHENGVSESSETP